MSGARGGPGAPAGTGASGSFDNRQRDLDNRNCDEALADHGDDAEWFQARPARQYRARPDANGDIVAVRKLSPEFFVRLTVELDIDDDEASIEKAWWRAAFPDADVDPRLRDQAMRAARRRAR